MPQCFSMMAGAEPMKHASEQKLMAAASASIRNSRCDSTVHEVATRLRALNGMRAAGGCVSGSLHHEALAKMIPQITMTANTARQPNATCTQPPMMGAMAGARLKIMVVRLMSRCAFAPCVQIAHRWRGR